MQQLQLPFELPVGRRDSLNPPRQRRWCPARTKEEQRIRWIACKWRISKHGNEYLVYNGHHVVVSCYGERWSYAIDHVFSHYHYSTRALAKAAAFEVLYQRELHGSSVREAG